MEQLQAVGGITGLAASLIQGGMYVDVYIKGGQTDNSGPRSSFFRKQPKILVHIVLKGGFKSEDTGKFLRLQHKYSKSLS